MEISEVWFDKYRIIRQIGQGASAEVFLAEHIGLQCFRAIKRISKQSQFYLLFMNEASILKNLKHPNIPVIYDIEEDDMYSYIILEYLEGQSLKAYRLCHSHIIESKMIYFILQVCDLFQYLHITKKPILYLDLKPDNILVDKDILKLIDFGAAVYWEEVNQRTRTLGTVGYASPEQYTGGVIDQRSNIFSIGTLIYFLITGESLKEEHVKEIPGAFLNYSRGFRDIVKKCLQYNPSYRYQTILQLKSQLLTLQKKGNKNKKQLKSSLRIAVAGTQSRIGVTHISIMLMNCIQHMGGSVLYVEQNQKNDVKKIAICYENMFLKNGAYKINQYTMVPSFINQNCSAEKDWEAKIKVYDIGALSDENMDLFLEADVKFLVAGAKEWELVYTREWVKKLSEYKEIHYLFNYVDGKEFYEIQKSIKERYCNRIPYQPNPFQSSCEKQFQSMIEEILSEWMIGKGKRE